MADTPKFDARLEEGVAYFEKMLEIMPEDRTTLEFLVVAYEQLGQHEKGQKALVSLVELLIKENDEEALKGLLPRLRESDYVPAKVLALKAERLTAPIPDLTPERPRELTPEEKAAASAREAISAEKALLAVLAEGGILEADEAKARSEELDALPVNGRVFLISAIQILEKENPSAAEKAIEYLADRFSIPPIPLGAYDVDRDLVRSFPEDLVRVRGVVPFARLGSITLVATLNPSDNGVRTAVEALGKTRFYLADSASSAEKAIAKAYDVQQGT